jgi:phage N-6-adenine-methyltransferase
VSVIEETARVRSMPVQKPGKSKQDYGTPLEFIRAVEARFGPLVCDLAASAENAKAPLYCDIERDSLTVSWSTEHPTGNLWLNPEFADIDPWAAKCAEESTKRHGLILLLTPASVGSNWFAKHVNRKAMVLGLSPRLQFEGTTAPYPKDLMLSVFGMGLSGFDCWRWKP